MSMQMLTGPAPARMHAAPSPAVAKLQAWASAVARGEPSQSRRRCAQMWKSRVHGTHVGQGATRAEGTYVESPRRRRAMRTSVAPKARRRLRARVRVRACACVCVRARACVPVCLRRRADGVPRPRRVWVDASAAPTFADDTGRKGKLDRVIRRTLSGGMNLAQYARARCDVRVGCAKSRHRCWHGRVQSRRRCGTKASHLSSAHADVDSRPGADVAGQSPVLVPMRPRCVGTHRKCVGTCARVAQKAVPIYGSKRTDDWSKDRDKKKPKGRHKLGAANEWVGAGVAVCARARSRACVRLRRVCARARL